MENYEKVKGGSKIQATQENLIFHGKDDDIGSRRK